MNETFPRPDSGRPRNVVGAPRAPCSRARGCSRVAARGLRSGSPRRTRRPDKPLNIEADNMTYDDLKQINIFTGHVVATKGTIVIKADRVEVTPGPAGLSVRDRHVDRQATCRISARSAKASMSTSKARPFASTTTASRT